MSTLTMAELHSFLTGMGQPPSVVIRPSPATGPAVTDCYNVAEDARLRKTNPQAAFRYRKGKKPCPRTAPRKPVARRPTTWEHDQSKAERDAAWAKRKAELDARFRRQAQLERERREQARARALAKKRALEAARRAKARARLARQNELRRRLREGRKRESAFWNVYQSARQTARRVRRDVGAEASRWGSGARRAWSRAVYEAREAIPEAVSSYYKDPRAARGALQRTLQRQGLSPRKAAQLSRRLSDDQVRSLVVPSVRRRVRSALR